MCESENPLEWVKDQIEKDQFDQEKIKELINQFGARISSNEGSSEERQIWKQAQTYLIDHVKDDSDMNRYVKRDQLVEGHPPCEHFSADLRPLGCAPTIEQKVLSKEEKQAQIAVMKKKLQTGNNSEQ